MSPVKCLTQWQQLCYYEFVKKRSSEISLRFFLLNGSNNSERCISISVATRAKVLIGEDVEGLFRSLLNCVQKLPLELMTTHLLKLN